MGRVSGSCHTPQQINDVQIPLKGCRDNCCPAGLEMNKCQVLSLHCLMHAITWAHTGKCIELIIQVIDHTQVRYLVIDLYFQFTGKHQSEPGHFSSKQNQICHLFHIFQSQLRPLISFYHIFIPHKLICMRNRSLLILYSKRKAKCVGITVAIIVLQIPYLQPERSWIGKGAAQ